MKFNLFIYILFLCVSTSLFSQISEVESINNRALESVDLKPSLAIFYAENALDKNTVDEDIYQTFISYYILARSYKNISENTKSQNNYDIVNEFIEKNVINSINKSILIDIVDNLLENNSQSLKIITDNLKLKESDDPDLLILDFRIEVSLNRDLLLSTYSSLRKTFEDNELKDKALELDFYYANFLKEESPNKAVTFFQRSMNSNNELISAKSLFYIWEITGYLSYLEEALLKVEVISNYTLQTDILVNLKTIYENNKDFKNLSNINNKLNYINSYHYNFLIGELKNMSKIEYEKDKLFRELQISSNLTRLYFLIIVSLGVVILLLIIRLSIQTYRLRDYNI